MFVIWLESQKVQACCSLCLKSKNLKIKNILTFFFQIIISQKRFFSYNYIFISIINFILIKKFLNSVHAW